jgi:hypothetical protein
MNSSPLFYEGEHDIGRRVIGPTVTLFKARAPDLTQRGFSGPSDFNLYIVQSPLSDSFEKLIVLGTGAQLASALPVLKWPGIFQDMTLQDIFSHNSSNSSDFMLVLTPSLDNMEIWSKMES